MSSRLRRIVRVAYSEHDLKAGIILVAERAQTAIKLVLGAAQRLQNGDRGRGSRPGLCRCAPQPHCKPRRDGVSHGERGESGAAGANACLGSYTHVGAGYHARKNASAAACNATGAARLWLMCPIPGTAVYRLRGVLS